jgi:hypothetical protein
MTARIAGILFAFAFMASSIQYYLKGIFTFWLLSNRKYLGVSFAIVHLIHLALLVVLHEVFHPIFHIAATSSLVSGGIAYFFTIAMLLTSFDNLKRRISSKNWKILHTVGGYWIWMIFFISYMKRVDTELVYLPLVLLFALTLILRILKLVAKKGS